MVSFRTSGKFISYLVRVELYSLERTGGSRKCSKKRCEVCENVQNLDDKFSILDKPQIISG